jgi:hypothetical protein
MGYPTKEAAVRAMHTTQSVGEYPAPSSEVPSISGGLNRIEGTLDFLTSLVNAAENIAQHLCPTPERQGGGNSMVEPDPPPSPVFRAASLASRLELLCIRLEQAQQSIVRSLG